MFCGRGSVALSEDAAHSNGPGVFHTTKEKSSATEIIQSRCSMHKHNPIIHFIFTAKRMLFFARNDYPDMSQTAMQ
jgi:hypothetical protein